MSWMLFLDESGHDHKTMPYEVRGGFAIHATKLWAFIQAVKALEQATFGAYLYQYGSEIKGEKLLKRRRFEWAKRKAPMEPAERRKHALNFLNAGQQGLAPRHDEFTAYGQACLAVAEGIFDLLRSHDAQLFASIIPRCKKPREMTPDLLRKDHVFLLERFFYFLESKREMGLLVMDGSDKSADRQFVKCMERYFTLTQTGRQRTQWIVPAPMFVESDMAYGVQVADLCIYTLNSAWRIDKRLTEPARDEVEPFAQQLHRTVWHGDAHKDGRVFQMHSVCYVPDPYEARRTGA